LGSFEFSLGMLAMAMHKFELAVDHLERSHEVHRAFRSQRLLVQSDYALGNALIWAGRTAEGYELRKRAIATAERMGTPLRSGAFDPDFDG
jgi:hypothetical protein